MIKEISLLTCLISLASLSACSQTKTVRGTAVCINHIGTIGTSNGHYIPLAIGDTRSMAEACRKETVKRQGIDITLPYVVPASEVATLLKEIDASHPNKDSGQPTPRGTFAFTVITTKDQKTSILGQRQTILLLVDFLRDCKRGPLCTTLNALKSELEENL